MGWFSNDVSGEWDGVDLASQGGSPVIAGRLLHERHRPRRVHRADLGQGPAGPADREPKNKVYVTLTFGEGDNIQYCQRRMRDIWDDPKRGEALANWTISPLLAEIGPGLFSYFQRTATANDLLVCGPSGAGYTYPGSWPADQLTPYLELSGAFMRRTGMDLVYAYNNRQDGTAGSRSRRRSPRGTPTTPR